MTAEVPTEPRIAIVGGRRDREEFERAIDGMAREHGRRFSRLEPRYGGSEVVCGPADAVTTVLGERRFDPISTVPGRVGGHPTTRPACGTR